MTKVYCYIYDEAPLTKKMMTAFAKGCGGEVVYYQDGHKTDGVLVFLA